MKHRPPHIFDRVFKRLMHSSGRAMTGFINGLFGKEYPPGSKVGYHSTEAIKNDLGRIISDIVLVVNGVDRYLIEAQTRNDGAMAWRILDYSYHAAWREESNGEPVATVVLPAAVVIYLEHTAKTPDALTMRLVAPDGGELEYKVSVIKFLDCRIEELEERRMTLLLPFYILKLRRQAARGGTRAERLRLAAAMRDIIEKITGALRRGVESETITAGDHDAALDMMSRLYADLYNSHAELKGVHKMAERLLVTRVERAVIKERKEIARKLILKQWPTNEIAKTVGLKPSAIAYLRRKTAASATQ